MSNHIQIYTDGACSLNGRKGAKAGYGIYIVDDDGLVIDSISKPLDLFEPQTNQRAELQALYVALQKAAELNKKTDIYTDSKYAMQCLVSWIPTWIGKDWKKADGKPALHQDILKPMWDIWKSNKSRITLHHINSHTGKSDIHSIGNDKADTLARSSLLN